MYTYIYRYNTNFATSEIASPVALQPRVPGINWASVMEPQAGTRRVLEVARAMVKTPCEVITEGL